MAGVTFVPPTGVLVGDPTFRAYAQSIHDNIVAAGWVAATDTGQINLATATRPATNTSAGYEIYKFNDALQATKPIFVKIEYGTTSSQGAPSFWFTIGTGTDGAGTITGTILCPRRQVAVFAPGSITTATCYASGGNERMALALNPNDAGAAGQSSVFFAVERTKDAAGADTNEGIFYVVDGPPSTGVINHRWGAFTHAGSGIEEQRGFMPGGFTVDSSNVNGSDVVLNPVYGSAKVSRRPYHTFVGFAVNDIVAGTSFACSPDGVVSHTYMALGVSSQYLNNCVATTGTNVFSANPRLAMRYD